MNLFTISVKNFKERGASLGELADWTEDCNDAESGDQSVSGQMYITGYGGLECRK